VARTKARCGKRSKYSFVANGAFTPAPWNYNVEWTPLFQFCRDEFATGSHFGGDRVAPDTVNIPLC
jgi:hypothetical protein